MYHYCIIVILTTTQILQNTLYDHGHINTLIVTGTKITKFIGLSKPRQEYRHA
jgi:hypothetical protein